MMDKSEPYSFKYLLCHSLDLFTTTVGKQANNNKPQGSSADAFDKYQFVKDMRYL